MLKGLVFAAVFVALAGCNSTPKSAPEGGTSQSVDDNLKKSDSEKAVAPPIVLTPLDNAIRGYYQYSSGYADSARLVIRDEAAWSDVWTRLVSNSGPKPALPSVDFATEMLIVATLGTRSSGGYSIKVTAAEQLTDHIAVTILRTSPGRSCGTTAALTAPADVVRMRRSDLPVRFIEQSTVHECS